MAQVNWTFQALEDIDEIATYLSNNSTQYASYIVDLLLNKGDLLATFPKMGRIVPETNLTSIREIIAKNYRIIYSLPDNDTVHILTVRHSSRPLDEIPPL